MRVKVEASADALASEVAEIIVKRANEAKARHARFSLVLSGGRTPILLFKKLVGRDIPWGIVDLFWGDERMVPPDHADSNFGQARLALLDHVAIPAANVHRIKGELNNPNESAKQYEAGLRNYFGTGVGPSRFDLVLLGMGGDGHTASLFPGLPLHLNEDKWVSAYYVEKMKAYRISLLPRLLNTAREVAILVTGEEKAPVLRQIFSNAKRSETFPVESIRPESGELTWYLDTEAAKGVDLPK